MAMIMISMETMNICFDIRPALYDAEVSEEVEDVGKDRLQKKRWGKEKISEIFWKKLASTNWDCDHLWWLLLDGDDGECGDVGCGAEPEDNGEDDDKILSHCLELYKSGRQCWAGSDPGPRTWLKQLRHQAFEIPLHNHHHHQ